MLNHVILLTALIGGGWTLQGDTYSDVINVSTAAQHML